MDEYVFVVMEGGLTQNEETLIAAGKEELLDYLTEAAQTAREQELQRVHHVPVEVQLEGPLEGGDAVGVMAGEPGGGAEPAEVVHVELLGASSSVVER